MQILAVDHFYDQDLQALVKALRPEDAFHVIPATRFRRLAERAFPVEAFATPGGPFAADLAPCWRQFTPKAERLADWLLAAYLPDVFVLPSDSLFYLRPIISRLAVLGVPTVVVQKETTITSDTMEAFSQEVGRYLPFMSCLMTVCSERQREFWVRSGAEPARLIVTGQPRFDVYRWSKERAQTDKPPVLLYLSYDDDAYVPPYSFSAPGDNTWRGQRRETEEVLAQLAEGGWRIVAKRHPQQLARDDWLGPRVERADSNSDTRLLIVAADVVVGFQTTALFEAALAGKRTVHAGWGNLYERVRPDLIPFQDHPGAVTHVGSPGELARALENWQALPRPDEAALFPITEHLGPCDGKAGDRVVAILRDLGERASPTPALPTSHRRERALALLRGAVAHAAPAGTWAFPGKADGFRRVQSEWRIQAAEARRIGARNPRSLCLPPRR